MSCRPKVLISEKHVSLAQCLTCHRIGLQYHHTMIGFNEDEFIEFANAVGQINFSEQYVEFQNGDIRVLIDSCHTDIQFAFLKPEYEEFNDFLQQGVILLEANRLLKKQDKNKT